MRETPIVKETRDVDVNERWNGIVYIMGSIKTVDKRFTTTYPNGEMNTY